MSRLDKWMVGGKISKLVIVITNKDTGEHVERWRFDVSLSPRRRPVFLSVHCRAVVYADKRVVFSSPSAQVQIFKPTKSKSRSSKRRRRPGRTCPLVRDPSPAATDKTEAEIQAEIAAIFRQITASVTFASSTQWRLHIQRARVRGCRQREFPSDGATATPRRSRTPRRVQLRGFSTASHRVDTLVSYRLAD